ncbi:hypothetical protein QBC32DRAFT_206015 [Pseudoneurospora amorphoporcata]|uniref:Uncharacterized protein n=1 Tax=Pseudoneurospora amorphoporcata TaxID=241081 RepID=A0AAN6NZS9_9PEZI|nr:hypothetical protein QBC32DRAFT_206015 [Pseudoneurospora amorphoporcata]
MRRPTRIHNPNLTSCTCALDWGKSLRATITHPPYPRHQSETRTPRRRRCHLPIGNGLALRDPAPPLSKGRMHARDAIMA